MHAESKLNTIIEIIACKEIVHRSQTRFTRSILKRWWEPKNKKNELVEIQWTHGIDTNPPLSRGSNASRIQMESNLYKTSKNWKKVKIQWCRKELYLRERWALGPDAAIVANNCRGGKVLAIDLAHQVLVDVCLPRHLVSLAFSLLLFFLALALWLALSLFLFARGLGFGTTGSLGLSNFGWFCGGQRGTK